jgi:two-component system sensor histidine kinase KdpD
MESVARRVFKTIAALAIIAALTFLFYKVLPVNGTTVALVFVLAILAIATAWGLTEAILASVLAMLCFNFFFLPPIGTLTIADPQNWLALLTFLITAIVASQLSAIVRKREREATARRDEVEKLYELSRAVMLTAHGKLAAELPAHIVRIFGASGVAFYDRATGEVHRAGPRDVPLPDARLKDMALQGTAFQDPAASLITLPVSLGGQCIGALSVLGAGISEAVVHAFANLMAIAIETEHAHELANRAEAARQNEQLKSTLLDAVAHDFKTPLTSIKAAATALLAGHSREGDKPEPDKLEPNERESRERELLTVVDEESDRLTQLVDEAIQVARIEAGQLKLERRTVSLLDIVRPAMRRVEALQQDRVFKTEIDPELNVSADPEQIQLVLRQILDNALKYSPARSEITLRADVDGGHAVVSIADQGPGIAEHDIPHIFDRFYRGKQIGNRLPGTGMGLTIAREIVQAHGGRIAARNLPGKGAEFSFTLPLVASQ